jgi:hypothetical protein
VDLLTALPRLHKGELVFSTTGATAPSGWSRAKQRLDRLCGGDRRATGVRWVLPATAFYAGGGSADEHHCGDVILGSHPDDKGVRAYARRHQISPASVRAGIAHGRIPVGQDGRILVAAADAALAKGTLSGARVSPSLANARRRKLAASVRLLEDEIAALRADCVSPTAARDAWLEACRLVAAEVVKLIEVGPRLAGLPYAASFLHLRYEVDALLNRLVDVVPEAEAILAATQTNVAIAKLSAVELATRRADLQAERMELRRSLRRNTMVSLGAFAAAAEDVIARSRSLLLAVPSRCSPLFELGCEAGVKALTQDLRHALAELAVHGVKEADFVPAALREPSPC